MQVLERRSHATATTRGGALRERRRVHDQVILLVLLSLVPLVYLMIVITHNQRHMYMYNL